MPPRAFFRLRDRAAIAAAIAAALPGAVDAAAPAGRVNFAIGNVSRSGDGSGPERLRRGSVVNTGDTIKTARGRVQIRFNDGGYMSLKPNTEFRIDEFEFDSKPSGARKGFFSLLRGGLRTITGLIGKRDRNSYRLKTRVATIGIRGTAFGVNDDGVAVDLTTLVGFIESCNAGGCVIGAPGAVAKYVSDTAPATVSNDSSNSNTTSASEEDNQDQQEAVTLAKEDVAIGERTVEEVTSGLPSGPGYALALAFSDGDIVEGSFNPGLNAGDPVNATFVGTNSALVGYEGPAPNVGSRSLGSNVAVEFGADGIIGWGRWVNGVTGGIGSNSHPGALDLTGGSPFSLSHHYVLGKPTELMPQAGIVNYVLLTSTTPTLVSGEGNPSDNRLNSGGLVADFGAGTVKLDLNVTAKVDGFVRNFSVDDLNMGIAQLGDANTHAFAGSDLRKVVNGDECSGGCFIKAEGFFAGANAARAGLAYEFNTGKSSGAGPQERVQGAAAFKRP